MHSFTKAITNSQCALCARPEIDHTDNAKCEACSYTGNCEITITNPQLLLCPECMAKEEAIRTSENPPIPFDPKRERIVTLLNLLDRQIPEDRRGYFVGRIHAIVDIEEALKDGDNPNYALAEVVENNLRLMKTRIVEKQKEIRELQGSLIADQKYLNQLVPKLREEERTKFKDFDITYKPTQALPVVTTPGARKSAGNKALESMAKLMGVSIEQLQASLASGMSSVTGNKCTCQETPGICKVHVK